MKALFLHASVANQTSNPLLMKYICLLLFLSVSSLVAQPFFGFQTNTVHTCYLTVGFGQKGDVGFGYQFRDFNASFTDWNLELRYPRAHVWQKGHAEVRLGFYRPFRIKKNFSAVGFHLRIEQRTQDETTRTNVRGVLSLTPGRVLTSGLSDQPYVTAQARLSYAPVLGTRTRTGSEKSPWKTFAAHGIEVGGHLDAVLKRSLALASNLVWQYTFTSIEALKPQADKLPLQGDIYVGSGYYLRRW